MSSKPASLHKTIKIAQTAGRIGLFYIAWSKYELTLEAIIKNLSKSSARHNSIIMCSLGIQPKVEIAISLLNEYKPENYEQIISTIFKTQQDASRNHITHSTIVVKEDDEHGALVLFRKRDIK